jgi:hypothetical protein
METAESNCPCGSEQLDPSFDCAAGQLDGEVINVPDGWQRHGGSVIDPKHCEPSGIILGAGVGEAVGVGFGLQLPLKQACPSGQ